MKHIKYKNIKNINNLPKYDLGTNITDTGYQQGLYFSPTSYVITSPTNLTPSVDAMKKATVANGLSKGLDLATQTGQQLQQFGAFNNFGKAWTNSWNSSLLGKALGTGNAAAKSMLIVNTASSGASEILNGASELGIELGAEAATPTMQLTTEGASTAASGTSSALSGISQAAGPLLSLAGIGLNSISLADTLHGIRNDYLKSNDIQNMTGQAMESGVGGVGYKVYTGYDKQGVMDYTKQQQKLARTSTLLSTAGLGMSSGALVAGLPGMIVGGLAGLIGGLFVKDKRDEKIREEMENWDRNMYGYNAQSESEANSKGLRNLYYSTHYTADKGKPEHMNIPNDPQNSDVVYTNDGVKVGKPNALTGKGETIVNFNEGTAQYIHDGKKRVDNIPTYAKPSDAIIGNGTDPYTNMKYSEMAAPFSQHMEAIDRLKPKTNDKRTLAVYLREANKLKQRDLQALKEISDRQSVFEHNVDPGTGMPIMADKGKCAKCDSGWTPYVMSVLPTIGNVAAGLNRYYQAKGEDLSTRNTYVANPYATQAFKLMNSNYNVNPQLDAINDAVQQSMYAINQSAGYTPGLRMAMKSKLFGDMMKNRAAVYNAAEEHKAKNNAALAQAMLAEGQNAATRQQSAGQQEYEWLARAKAARQKYMDTAMNGVLGNINNMFLNINNGYWSNKYIDLYDKTLSK